MESLTDLPNIGKTLARKLNGIDVKSIQDLVEMGSESAIIKISSLENSGACINMLYALEGAKQGIRWHHLSDERKLELKAFYNQLKTL